MNRSTAYSPRFTVLATETNLPRCAQRPTRAAQGLHYLSEEMKDTTSRTSGFPVATRGLIPQQKDCGLLGPSTRMTRGWNCMPHRPHATGLRTVAAD